MISPLTMWPHTRTLEACQPSVQLQGTVWVSWSSTAARRQERRSHRFVLDTEFGPKNSRCVRYEDTSFLASDIVDLNDQRAPSSRVEEYSWRLSKSPSSLLDCRPRKTTLSSYCQDSADCQNSTTHSSQSKLRGRETQANSFPS